MLEMCFDRYNYVVLDNGFLCHYDTRITIRDSIKIGIFKTEAEIKNIEYFLRYLTVIYRNYKGQKILCRGGDTSFGLRVRRLFLRANSSELRRRKAENQFEQDSNECLYTGARPTQRRFL